MAIFVKSSTLTLEYVWNWKGSQFTSAPLENTNNLSSEKGSGLHKHFYENVCDEGCF